MAKHLVTTRHTEWLLRKAELADRPPLLALHARSLRALALEHYGAADIEAFLAAGTLDDDLLRDGRYFVADWNDAIVGCGGWSTRLPGYLGAASHVATEPPRLRAMFVDPSFTRRGIGAALVRHIEADVMAHGFPVLTLDALLSGVALYRAMGYLPMQEGHAPLPGGASLPFIHMQKRLATEAGIVSTAQPT